MKHKHTFKRVGVTLEKARSPFDHLDLGVDLEAVETAVTRYRCKCGETQEFHDVPDGEWNKSLSDEFTTE